MAATRPAFMSDRDAGARDTVYQPKKKVQSVSAPAKKVVANNGPVKYAGTKSTSKKVPTPTARPNASTFGSSGGPQSAKNYKPSGDTQYNTYSTSGATQSAQKRPSTPSDVGGFAANARSKSDLNNFKQSESRYSADQMAGAAFNAKKAPVQGPPAPKKKRSSTDGFISIGSKYSRGF